MYTLSEVISKLVEDSASGVQAAEAEVEKRKVELAELLKKPPEELVEEEEVDDFLRNIFPDPRNPKETAIRPGVPYFSPTIERYRRFEEFPPIERVLGIRLTEKDLTRENDRMLLTKRAVKKVRDAVKQMVGRKRKLTLKRLMEQGIPRPVVETVDLEVKLAFDENLRVRVPNLYEADVKMLPEAIGKMAVHLRFEKG